METKLTSGVQIISSLNKFKPEEAARILNEHINDPLLCSNDHQRFRLNASQAYVYSYTYEINATNWKNDTYRFNTHTVGPKASKIK